MKFRTAMLFLFAITGTVAMVTLQGCSVNVIVAPHATMSVDSDLSTNPYLYQEASPLYDCVGAPDADVCQ